MTASPPTLLAIDHDDYHAEHVGRTSDGHQFFLTTPFNPKSANSAGSEYVACYVFDSDGNLLDAKIDDFGPCAELDDDERRKCYEQRLSDLGEITFGRIQVKPFAVERFGTTFGLVAREPDDENGQWAVEIQPGNYMAFFEPWDSGVYDT